MNKKLIYLAVAFATSPALSARTHWIPSSPISVISGEDTLATNPANIVDLLPQVAVTNTNLVAARLEAFGQPIAIHIGTEPNLYAPNTSYGTNPNGEYTLNNNRMGLDNFNALDQEIGFHWGSNAFDFASLGVSLEASENNFSDLYSNTLSNAGTGTFAGADGTNIAELPRAYYMSFNIPTGGDYSDVAGNVTNAVDVSSNERKVTAMNYNLVTGFKFRDLPLEARVGLTLPFYKTSANFDSVESETDSGANTLDRVTQSYEESVGRSGGLVFNTWGRYRLSEDLNITGYLFSQKDTVTAEYKVNYQLETDTDTSDATLTTDETWNLSETQTAELSDLVISTGVEYSQSFNQGGIQLSSMVTFESEKTTANEKLDHNTYVDAITPANNTEDITGINNSSYENTTTTYSLPVYARLHYDSSENWTWYFAAWANILEIQTEKDIEKVYQVNATNDGYEVDYETTTVTSSAWMKADTFTFDIGAQHRIIDNVTGDYQIGTDATLQNWYINWGLSATF